MTALGFKQLDINNWLKPDPVSLSFMSIDASGQPHVMTGDDWVKLILRPQLADTAPLEVKRLFEVARGAMVYGFLFYPVYTLAVEQLFRIAETAVKLKCEAMGAPCKINKFKSRLEWLMNNGIISAREEHNWQKVRDLRNASSHPADQTVLPPGWTIDFSEYIVTRINALFQ